MYKLCMCPRGNTWVEMLLRVHKCWFCTVAVGCCVGSLTRGQMSGLVLCAVNQPAIRGTCGSSGRQGCKRKLLMFEGVHTRICKCCFFSPITVNLWHFSRSNPGVRTWTEYPPLIEIKSTSFGMKRTFQKGNISCHTSSMLILSQVSSSAKVLSFPLKSSWVVLWNSAHMTRTRTHTQFPLKRHSHNCGFAGSDTVFYKMLCTLLVSQMLIVEIHQLASSNLQLLSINHTEH